MYDAEGAPRPLVERTANGRFAPGNSGRPRGARNRVSQGLAQAVLADFQTHKDEILSRLRRDELVAYVKFVSRLLPICSDEPEEPDPEAFSEATMRSRLAAALVDYNGGRSRGLDSTLDGALADPDRRQVLEELAARPRPAP